MSYLNKDKECTNQLKLKQNQPKPNTPAVQAPTTSFSAHADCNSNNEKLSVDVLNDDEAYRAHLDSLLQISSAASLEGEKVRASSAPSDLFRPVLKSARVVAATVPPSLPPSGIDLLVAAAEASRPEMFIKFIMEGGPLPPVQRAPPVAYKHTRASLEAPTGLPVLDYDMTVKALRRGASLSEILMVFDLGFGSLTGEICRSFWAKSGGPGKTWPYLVAFRAHEKELLLVSQREALEASSNLPNPQGSNARAAIWADAYLRYGSAAAPSAAVFVPEGGFEDKELRRRKQQRDKMDAFVMRPSPASAARLVREFTADHPRLYPVFAEAVNRRFSPEYIETRFEGSPESRTYLRGLLRSEMGRRELERAVRQASLKLEGAASSTTMVEPHTVEAPDEGLLFQWRLLKKTLRTASKLADVVDSVVTIVESIPGAVIKFMKAFDFHSILAIAQLIAADTKIQIGLALAQMAVSPWGRWIGFEAIASVVGLAVGGPALVEKMKEKYKGFKTSEACPKAFREAPAGMYVPEAGTIENAATFAAELTGSPVVAQMGAIGVLFASTKMFASLPEGFHAALAVAKQFLGEYNGEISFVGALSRMFVLLVERAKEFQRTGDVGSLFGISAYRIQLMQLHECLEDLKKARLGGPGAKDPRSALAKAKECLFELGKIDDKNGQVSRSRTELYQAIVSFEKGLIIERVPPVSFIVTGPAGCGKTTLIASVTDIVRAIHKVPTDVEIKHTYTDDTNFQKIPAVCLVLEFGDHFQIKDEYANGSVSVLQAAADSTPFIMEGASIEEKNNSMIDPAVVAVSTNNAVYTFSKMTSGANKLDRRYEVIEAYYTDIAMELSEQADCPLDRLRVMFPDRQDLVRYRVGRMKNDPRSNQIRIAIDGRSVDRSENDLLVYLRMAVRARYDRLDVPPVRQQRLKCKFGVPLPHNEQHCGCYEVGAPDEADHPPPELYADLFDPNGPEEEVLPARRVPIHLYGMHPEGTAPSRVQLVPDLMDVVSKGIGKKVSLDSLYAAFDASTAGFFGEDYIALKVAAVMGASGLFVFGIIQAVAALYSLSSTPESTITTSVSGVAQDRSWVRPLAGSAPGWLFKPCDAVYKVARPGSDGLDVRLYGILVLQGMLAVPAHFFDGCAGMSEIMIKVSNLDDSFSQILKVPSTRIIHANSHDLAFICPHQFKGQVRPCFTDIIAAHPRIGTSMRAQYNGGEGDVTVTADGNFVHFFKSQAGDCGLPFIVAGKIIGFHIGAMDESSKVGQVLTQEYIKAAADLLAKQDIRLTPPPGAEPTVFKKEGLKFVPGMSGRSDAAYLKLKEHEVFVNAGHCPVAFLPSRDTSKMSGTKTEMWDVFGPLAGEYAVPNAGKAKLLKSGEWVSAVTSRMRGMAKPALVDDVRMRKAITYALSDLPVPERRLEVLTWHQCLVGDPASYLVRGKDTSKAVGASYSLMGGTKAMAFQENPDGTWDMDPWIMSEMERMDQEVRSGLMPQWIARATVKDEMFPIEKVEAGKARLFYVCDVAFNMLMRKYLLCLLTYILENPFQSSVIGVINPGSKEWKKLYDHITYFGVDRILETDQTNYDLHHSVLIIPYATFMEELALKCGYSKEESAAVYTVCCAAFSYYLLMEGNLFYCTEGLASGRADTLVCNSVISKIAMYYCFLEIDGRSPSLFLRIANTGDDNLTGVSRDAPLFTGEALKEAQARLGYVITDGHKQAVIDFIHINKATYLKREFRVEGENVYAPLATKSIYKSLAYRLQFKGEERDRSVGTIYSAAREFFLHGRPAYDDFIETCRKLEFFHTLTPPSFEQCAQEFELGVFEPWSVVTGQGESDSGGVHYKYPAEPVKHSTRQYEHYAPVAGAGIELLLGFRETESQKRSAFWEQSARGSCSAELNDTQDAKTVTVTAPVMELLGVDHDVEHVPDTGSKRFDHLREGISFQEKFSRPRRIASLVPSASQVSFNPWALYLAIPAVNNITKGYSLRRGTMKITLQYTGNPSIMGRARFAFWPVGTPTVAVPFPASFTPTASSYPYTSTWPHLDLDYSQPCMCSIDLPFSSAAEYELMGAQSWIMWVIGMNGPQSATGITVSAPIIDVYASVPDMELNVIIPEAAHELPAAALSNALSYGAMVAAALPFPWAGPVQRMLAMGSDVAKFFGFSRPNADTTQIVVSRRFGSIACASGTVDTGYCLALDPAVVHDSAGTMVPFSTPTDTNVRKLLNTPSEILQHWDWNTIVVDPGCYTSSGTINYIPPVGGVAQLFRYWKGGLKYTFKIYSSPLVRWRFAIQIIPPGIAVPATYNPDGGVLTKVVDAVGSIEFDFEVPYLYQDNFKAFSRVNVEPPIGVGTTRMKLWSIYGPVGPGLACDNPSVSVWVSAGSDFSVGVPDLRQLNFSRLVYAGESGVGPASLWAFGEQVEDLGLLARRPCDIMRFHNRSDTTLNFTVDFPTVGMLPGEYNQIGNTPYDIGVTASNWSYFTYLQTVFFAWTGGVRHKFSIYSTNGDHPFMVGEGVAQVGANPIMGSTYGGFNSSSSGSAIMWSNSEALWEVNVPTRAPFYFNPMPSSPVLVGSVVTTWGTNCVMLDPLSAYPNNGTYDGNWMISAADDVKFSGFLGFPPFVARS